jgi:nucleoside-diphosphate-sugar epimerase
MAEKPSVLIIGGLGYIGRFLALHIHQNELASDVRLVDKVLPQLAWLAPEFSEACSQDKFMQADASRPGKIFTLITLISLLTIRFPFSRRISKNL